MFSVQSIAFYCNAFQQGIITKHYDWAESVMNEYLVKKIQYLFPETNEYIEHSYSALALAFDKITKSVTKR